MILVGDCLERLRELPDASAHCCVTSPPYFGLRNYGVDGQMGLESTPDAFVAGMVEVFREVRRVLRDDGTLWLNIGDSYANDGKWGGHTGGKHAKALHCSPIGRQKKYTGLKPKDLIGIPWMLAFALREPWTDWQISSEAMRAWVAGIVDGEGCITIQQTKSSHSDSLSFPPIIQVKMCDREPLDRLVAVAGSKIGEQQHPPSYIAAQQRPSWQWKVTAERAAKIIAEIYPFLTCKRKQAIVAWNHQMFRTQRGNGPRAQSDLEREQFCKALINDLNQRRTVDLPSWMIEPKIIQEPGWYLRQDCIWSKPNPMPESVRDRCTKAHEYIFMFSKGSRYYYDADAIAEPAVSTNVAKFIDRSGTDKQRGHGRRHAGFNGRYAERLRTDGAPATRNKRSVWTVATKPFKETHFATYPPDLIEPCILAGSLPGGTVLDPFFGAGTTGLVALRHGRRFIGCELNSDYVEIAERRLAPEMRAAALRDLARWCAVAT